MIYQVDQNKKFIRKLVPENLQIVFFEKYCY